MTWLHFTKCELTCSTFSSSVKVEKSVLKGLLIYVNLLIHVLYHNFLLYSNNSFERDLLCFFFFLLVTVLECDHCFPSLFFCAWNVFHQKVYAVAQRCNCVAEKICVNIYSYCYGDKNHSATTMISFKVNWSESELTVG